MAVDALRADGKLEGDALLADYVQRYRSPVERLCRILLGDPSDAEDATQQTFLLAYQSLLTGTRPHHPRAWLCTIARRECWARDHRRRRERSGPREEPRAEPDPAERTVLRAELATITTGLEQLPVRQKQAIVLRELAGLSYTQLAAALEVSESAAEALLVRARRNLREVRLLLFLIPFPRSLRRLFRHGSGQARSAVGVPAAKAVAVATIVTATVAVAGSGVPAERAVEPAPIVAERTISAPHPFATRAPHRRVPARLPAVRHSAPLRARARSTKPTVAPVHVETTTRASATPSVTSAPNPGSAASSPSTAPHPPAPPSPSKAQTPRPHPSAPRPRPRRSAPKPVTPPHPAPPPTATTPSSPAPTDTGPAAPPPPPPTDTTPTEPSAPDEGSGTTSGADGDTKPGNGYGDQNHDHAGKR